MKLRSKAIWYAIVSLPSILIAGTTYGQDAPAPLMKTVLYHDSLFWQAYNACDIAGMEIYFTDDVEFYHDKGGLTTSKKTFFESVTTGLCGNPEWRLRREALKETIKVFPLNNYGAILSGEHVFYILEKGKTERLDGLAKFTHVWRFKENQWKMHRILSYDHGPAPYKSHRKELVLPVNILKQYAGQYKSEKAGVMTVVPEGSVLKLKAGEFQATLFSQAENIFFLKERDLQFEFVKDKDKVVKVVVRENGKMVEEAGRIQP